MKTGAELASIVLCAALAFGLYGLGHYEGYGDGISSCAVASAKAEAAALASVAKNYRAQLRAQTAVLARVQAAKSARAAALVSTQAQIRMIPVAPDCSIGPRTILALNALRGERP